VHFLCCVSVWCYGFSISGGNFGTAKLLGHIFPFIPFLQVMVCQLNEMCKRDGVRPHTANIAVIFVGLIEIVIRMNISQDLDVTKYYFILKNHCGKHLREFRYSLYIYTCLCPVYLFLLVACCLL
jgi:hypothetical protein